MLELWQTEWCPASRSDGPPLVGEEQILRWLERRLPLPPGAEAHRVKAAKARRRYLEEECECPPAPTP